MFAYFVSIMKTMLYFRDYNVSNVTFLHINNDNFRANKNNRYLVKVDDIEMKGKSKCLLEKMGQVNAAEKLR